MAAVYSSDGLNTIDRNEADKRVDKPLGVDAEGDHVKALAEANLCFNYHLRGKCENRKRSTKHMKDKHILTDQISRLYGSLPVPSYAER